MGRPPIKSVSRAVLREKFNRLYLSDVLGGNLRESIESQGPPNPKMNQPPGTLSQRVRYFDEDGRSVAVIHRYKLPDGTLGASGLPDPVAVLEQGTIFAAPSKPNPKKKRRGKRRR